MKPPQTAQPTQTVYGRAVPATVEELRAENAAEARRMADATAPLIAAMRRSIGRGQAEADRNNARARAGHTGGAHLRPPDGSKPVQRGLYQPGNYEIVGWGVDIPERVIVVDDLPEEERDEIRRALPGAKELVFPAVRWERRVRR